RRPRRSTLFPYTTLFRSGVFQRGSLSWGLLEQERPSSQRQLRVKPGYHSSASAAQTLSRCLSALERRESVICLNKGRSMPPALRSEEHTSELQSLTNLVC